MSLTILPDGRTLAVAPGVSVLEACRANDIDLPGICGGRGRCRECRVTVVGGEVAPSALDKSLLEPEDLARGWRLSCQLMVEGDLTVELPPVSLKLLDPNVVLPQLTSVEPVTSAYTNVDGAEDTPVVALNVNAFAVRALARAADSHGATLVHFSTDFVFDGTASAPYTEEDRPNPRSVYAASKLLGEWFALEAPRAYVLRVESLFGCASNGPAPKGSVAGIHKALMAGESPPVFVDRTISPTYVIDAARATRRLLESVAPPGLYHCVNSGSCSWLEFAQELARLAGVEPRVTPVRMSDVPLRAARPLYCALSNAKLRGAGIDMPSWQDALARHVATTD